MSPRPSMTVGAATLLTALALITPALTGCDPAPPVPETTPSAPATPASPTAKTTPASPTAKTTPPSPTAKATPAAKALRYVFPVDGKVSYGRFHALYPAADILARCGAVARSPVDGVVLELSRVDKFVKAAPDGADKGGLFVSIRGADGVRYYSAHLSTVGATLRPGAEVKAGDPIGLVGRTGNANNICHVHFALSPPCASAGDWWNRRGVVYPWPYLDSWRQGGVRSPAAAVAAWQRKPGCGTQAPPS